MWSLLIYRLLWDLPKGLNFQDQATENGELLLACFLKLLFILIFIFVSVIYFLFGSLIKLNRTSLIKLRYGSTLEIVWTLVPAVLIGYPSVKLVYAMDELIEPGITVKAIGMQWYWKYELGDFGKIYEWDSYLKSESDLKVGGLRLLEVDKPLLLPVGVKIRVVATSFDVMHSFAIPSLAVRIDAVPGRLNVCSFELKRQGVFRGVCAELCGSYHGNMPVVVEGCSLSDFERFLESL